MGVTKAYWGLGALGDGAGGLLSKIRGANGAEYMPFGGHDRQELATNWETGQKSVSGE